jgi:hypothetical protein
LVEYRSRICVSSARTLTDGNVWDYQICDPATLAITASTWVARRR